MGDKHKNFEGPVIKQINIPRVIKQHILNLFAHIDRIVANADGMHKQTANIITTITGLPQLEVVKRKITFTIL